MRFGQRGDANGQDEANQGPQEVAQEAKMAMSGQDVAEASGRAPPTAKGVGQHVVGVCGQATTKGAGQEVDCTKVKVAQKDSGR